MDLTSNRYQWTNQVKNKFQNAANGNCDVHKFKTGLLCTHIQRRKNQNSLCMAHLLALLMAMYILMWSVLLFFIWRQYEAQKVKKSNHDTNISLFILQYNHQKIWTKAILRILAIIIISPIFCKVNAASNPIPFTRTLNGN